ncbi:hypothetical protein [Nocardiopsis chromatogenes]|uniref:hypothetical protein n=1 Tax=Nocardiopsis chromatogenes TaxID=280239 RepID=UPI0004767081|nr:hypothetical protein [Nocardiopsis chromatogenes]
MRLEPPTPEEIRANFEGALESVRNGGGVNSETGLDMETEGALWAIAAAHPNIPDSLIETARAEFAAQMDGSHAAARRAYLERRFARTELDDDSPIPE